MRALSSARAALIVAWLFAMIPSRAEAHAFPVRSDPRVGWTVSQPPSKVIIWFDGELEPDFSTIEVHNSAKQRMDKGNSRVNSSDPSVLEVDLPVLAPSTYRVYSKVLSKDTHITEGDFFFTISDKAQ